MTLDCDRRVPSRYSESLTALLLLLGHDAHPCPGPSLGLHLKGHLVTRAFAMMLSPSARGHWSSQSSARNTWAASTLPGFHRPPQRLSAQSEGIPFSASPPEPSPHALPGGSTRLVHGSLCLSFQALPPQGAGLALLGLSSLVFLGCGCFRIRARKYRKNKDMEPSAECPQSPWPCLLGLPSRSLEAFAAPKERDGAHTRHLVRSGERGLASECWNKLHM